MRLINTLKAAGAAAILVAAAAASIAPASAEDMGFKGKSAGDILIRGRVVGVVPHEDVKSNTLPGEGNIDNDVIPELDFSYFITDNIALELIAGASKHSVDWDVNSSTNVDLGSVRLLPPTLTAQYHFLTKQRFSPYLGAGVNYTIFFDEKSGGAESIDYKNGFGLAFQAGFDYAISGPWSLNVDVKKIFLNTDVTTTVGGTTYKADADIDPWLFGVGIGYRF
jgi:outer membrane protein